ncbi:MAG: RyR domain-containing protein [Planctomycetaceae bacterium]
MPAQLDYDTIAKQIHEFYRAKYGGMLPYEELPEFMKADNREAAIRINHVLAMAGLRLVPLKEGETWLEEDQQAVRKVIEENLDLLAETEHNGWMAARIRHGWIKADKVDREKKESHLLVPYSEFEQVIARKRDVAGPAKFGNGPRKGEEMSLEEEVAAEKDKDRDAVNNYPNIIARTKYQIAEEE